jgi:hypothetical protein
LLKHTGGGPCLLLPFRSSLKLNLKEAEMRRLRHCLLQRNKTIVRMGNDDLFIHSEALNAAGQQAHSSFGAA